ncbi:MAG: response regulator transcription factor [Eggerthellaceae bacterium]|jgi:DNA-binding response OmpR family regulator|nr:response regulator transcription factor [Eggerthellaceae bacterium]MCH4221270.1 response regulator transcription factor [Eggerthellaceae bacterium]
MYSIFIVEDERPINKELATLLKRNGYETHSVISFDRITDEVAEIQPDLILLDLGLPCIDGLCLCRTLHRQSNVPIIIVTSRTSEVDELLSINYGADDYITKPYHAPILLARIASVLRRTHATHANIIEHNGVKLDLSNSVVTYHAASADLTKNELRILNLLMVHTGHIVMRTELQDTLWQSNEFIDDNTLTVNINRLRGTLTHIGVSNDFLQTKRGMGYRIP